MTSELGARLGDYVEAVAPTITLDEIRQIDPIEDGDQLGLASADQATERPSRRWIGVVAAAAAIVLVVSVAVAIRRADESSQVDVGGQPDPTATSVEASDEWLTPFGSESISPAVPAGWKLLDHGEVRFAVPSDWIVPINRSSAFWGPPDAVGLVLVPEDGATSSTCDPEPTVPDSVLTFGSALPSDRSGEPVTIGTLDATKIASTCVEACPDTYVLTSGLTVTVTGPDADAVLATFTDSGARRALQEGPVADRDGWKAIEYGGVTLDVPSDWTFVDLPATYKETVVAGGIQSTGRAEPGNHAAAMFGAQGEIIVGNSLAYPSGPMPSRLELEPGNGAWIRPVNEDQVDLLGTPSTSGAISGSVTPEEQASQAAALLDEADAVGGEVASIEAEIASDPAAPENVVRRRDMARLRGRQTELNLQAAHVGSGPVTVTVIDPGASARQYPAPVIDVVIRHPFGSLWLTIGSGTDASIVRSILRSLRAG